MKQDLKYLLPATCCVLAGFSIKSINPELGFTIFVTSFYFLEGWKSYVLHPKKEPERSHIKRK